MKIINFSFLDQKIIKDRFLIRLTSDLVKFIFLFDRKFPFSLKLQKIQSKIAGKYFSTLTQWQLE